MVSLVLGNLLQGRGKPFVLSTPELVAAHQMCFGVSGSGKSRYLASVWLQLVSQGVAASLIDPTGDMSRLILGTLIENKVFANSHAFDRLYYVNFGRADKTRTIEFNVLKQEYEPHAIAANMLEVCKRAWSSVSATPSLDTVILASTLVLVENGNLPFTELNRFLIDKPYRDSLISNVSDPLVGTFFNSWFDSKENNMAESTLRRSFLLTFSPVLRHALGTRENRLNQQRIINSGISCIYNLGGLDDYTKKFLGCLLMVNLEQAFQARAYMPEGDRRPHFVIVDEAPLFISESGESYAIFLDQVRKYKGTLILAAQAVSQTKALAGSLQNALTILFRVGYDDAQYFAQRFAEHDPYRIKHEVPRFPWEVETTHPVYFREEETVALVRHAIQSLDAQKALVRIGRQTTLIKSLSVPDPRVSSAAIDQIEEEYAQRLLVPVTLSAQAIPVIRGPELAPLPVVPKVQGEDAALLPPPAQKKRRGKIGG
jgi:hypothetical protein